ncbi:MAG: bifunctional (p)ppGpp synthetase/guanosine-3',5'-bis(diphosphate) 3'-pyrophosphohydrolase [Clostridiales bacterium]|nr:bifunctional (p)ppGpp synthetase/guanosine-3',5'-bis(diphosphate) 3'-pyrophosphohydrolase [Clostridiales bacterium]
METREEHYASMMQAITRYAPSADLEVIQRAYEYADEKHKNQLRKSGEPYIIHPLAVAEIVAEIGLDTDAITAALLHDCLEDTDASFEEISRMFGETVANLVEGVTKLTRVQYSTMEEQQMENLRKMFMAMSKDIRVILIKIADRLHNTRTLQYQTPAKQISKSMETMEVYAPLAHRLGMQKIKWELEDTSLQYLDPEGYQEIIDYLKKNEDSANSFMNAIQSKITNRLASVGIHGSIYGRIKHTYSIYRKMRAQNKTIDELYDLYAFRVIVDNIADCYNVLGHIHDLFNPIPGRFKDYISTPKPNMYQSLHTTVIGSQGIPFEVQIRTWEMHQTAEYGVAAHWKYKQHAGEGSEKEFEWVRRLLENQQDVEADDYIHSLKVDMFDDEVFVFTPKGKVISLPAGSTPIDFAYAIHSAVGNSMIGAKVNNRIASYDAPLHNGDIVEILTSKSAKGPSRDWLNICQSNQARIKIKQWFKREKRDENIVRGKTSFDAELRHIGVDPDLIQNDDVLPLVLKKVSFECLDDMYAAIGYGGLTAAKAVGRIRDDLTKASRSLAPKPLMRQETPAVNASGVIVEDIGSCMIKFSRCCTPVPGDEIIGFITKGYGVSVHRKDCPNAKSAQDPAQKSRWVKVTWAETPDALFSTSLEIEADDRDGLMLDVATILTSLRLRTSEMSARSVGGGTAIVCLRFGVHNLTELENVRTRLRGISGVHNVERGTE